MIVSLVPGLAGGTGGRRLCCTALRSLRGQICWLQCSVCFGFSVRRFRNATTTDQNDNAEIESESESETKITNKNKRQRAHTVGVCGDRAGSMPSLLALRPPEAHVMRRARIAAWGSRRAKDRVQFDLRTRTATTTTRVNSRTKGTIKPVHSTYMPSLWSCCRTCPSRQPGTPPTVWASPFGPAGRVQPLTPGDQAGSQQRVATHYTR